MAAKIKRAWYTSTVAGDTQLAIVEKTSRTVDGVTDAWQAVREVIKLRIELSTSDTDLSSVTSSYNEINARYHRTIVNKAIATGYRDPRNFAGDKAALFDSEWEHGLRRAKKFSKRNYISVGRIVPQDF